MFRQNCTAQAGNAVPKTVPGETRQRNSHAAERVSLKPHRDSLCGLAPCGRVSPLKKPGMAVRRTDEGLYTRRQGRRHEQAMPFYANIRA